MKKLDKETLAEFIKTIELILETEKHTKENIIRLTELKERLKNLCSKDKISKEEIVKIIELVCEILAVGTTVAALFPPG